MATWNSRGLRGSTLEDLINRTNEKYREQGLALIQKVPTPITPMKIDKEHRHITLALSLIHIYRKSRAPQTISRQAQVPCPMPERAPIVRFWTTSIIINSSRMV